MHSVPTPAPCPPLRSCLAPAPTPTPKDQEGAAASAAEDASSKAGEGRTGRLNGVRIERHHLESDRHVQRMLDGLVKSKRHPTIDGSDADLRWVLEAAERSLRLGKDPGALFRHLIDGDERGGIAREDERRAAVRYRRMTE